VSFLRKLNITNYTYFLPFYSRMVYYQEHETDKHRQTEFPWSLGQSDMKAWSHGPPRCVSVPGSQLGHPRKAKLTLMLTHSTSELSF
jgi:hypothetical protein